MVINNLETEESHGKAQQTSSERRAIVPLLLLPFTELCRHITADSTMHSGYARQTKGEDVEGIPLECKKITTYVSALLITLAENGGKDELVFDKCYEVLKHSPCLLFNSELVIFKQVHYPHLMCINFSLRQDRNTAS